MTENEIGSIVLESASAVHREWGPGLLETVYEIALAYELRQRGLKVERQVPVPIHYKEIQFEEGFRADLIAEGKVILELESVERTTAAHKKQVQTYLRLTGCKSRVSAQLRGSHDESRYYPLCQWPKGMTPCVPEPLRENVKAGFTWGAGM
jgi:GxxExxY protein